MRAGGEDVNPCSLPGEPGGGESAPKQFWADETGASMVGVAFRESAKQGGTLRLKRNQALEAAERANGTPGERKAEEKLPLSSHQRASRAAVSRHTADATLAGSLSDTAVKVTVAAAAPPGVRVT